MSLADEVGDLLGKTDLVKAVTQTQLVRHKTCLHLLQQENGLVEGAHEPPDGSVSDYRAFKPLFSFYNPGNGTPDGDEI